LAKEFGVRPETIKHLNTDQRVAYVCKGHRRETGAQANLSLGSAHIDIDILTFGDERVDEGDLQIPHPEMMHRVFVLAPLAEIDPTYLEAFAALPADEREQVQVVAPNSFD